MAIAKHHRFRIAFTTVMALLWSEEAAALDTRHFEHQDQRYLQPEQRRGGSASLPTVLPEAPVPLVVFLHGTNSSGELHQWFGGGRRDLRPLVARLVASAKVTPFVLAGPSQTKRATLPRNLWRGFDLAHFVDDVAQATSDVARIDRSRVIFMGHSGAGCNPSGGLASPKTGDLTPLAIVSIDPCLDDQMGRVFAHRPATVPLSVLWQSALWARAPDQFWSALQRHKAPGRVDVMTELSVPSINAHDAIVPLAFERALLDLLPNDARSAHSATSGPR